MEKVASNFNFSKIETLMLTMDEDHSTSTLGLLKNELNRFFIKAKCRDIIYTVNTDKLFFGMRVYPLLDGSQILGLLGDNKSIPFNSYYLEFDSKLFDPLLHLDQKELTAILLHEIGHIVYDTSTIDEVKAQVDMYFADTNGFIDLKATKGYKELLAYAMKDSVVKIGSIFSKIGDTEIVADEFVVSCGYGPYLESAIKKIATSANYLNKSVDNRLIAMSWVLRLNTEFRLKRIPAIKTLNVAKSFTASELEKREITYAVNILNTTDEIITEAIIDNVKSRFSKKFDDFKRKGIRAIKDDQYELNVRVRTAETREDLLYAIRTINTDIAILKDYATEEISNEERKEVYDTIAELTKIRNEASKNKNVRSTGDSLITVVYPEM